ncbi:hypothetical protein [Mesorhizobium sp. f-mel]
MFNKSKALPTADEAFSIPPIGDINPTIAELRARSVPIGVERQGLLNENFDLARSGDGGGDTDAAGAARVAEILGRSGSTVPLARADKIAANTSRIRDLDRAIGVLTAEIGVEVRRANAIMSARALPEYKRRMGDLIAALVTVHNAQQSIEALANGLTDAGYSSGDIGHHVPSWLGRGKGPNTPIACALRELSHDGFIANKDIPESLK